MKKKGKKKNYPNMEAAVQQLELQDRTEVTEAFLKSRAMYAEQLMRAWNNLLLFPSETAVIEGGFFSSLFFRLQALILFDLNNFKNQVTRAYTKVNLKNIIYHVLLVLLLIYPFYYTIIIVRYILWRLPHYVFAPVESFFENFLFLRLNSTNLFYLKVFYYDYLLYVKGLFIANWGWEFLRRILCFPIQNTDRLLDYFWVKWGRYYWKTLLKWRDAKLNNFVQAIFDIRAVGWISYFFGRKAALRLRKFYAKYGDIINLTPEGRRFIFAYYLVIKFAFLRNFRITKIHIYSYYLALPWRLRKLKLEARCNILVYWALKRHYFEYYILWILLIIYTILLYTWRVIAVIPSYLIYRFFAPQPPAEDDPVHHAMYYSLNLWQKIKLIRLWPDKFKQHILRCFSPQRRQRRALIKRIKGLGKW